MIAMGSYFLIFVSVIGTIFAVLEITPEKEKQFFETILNEHNRYRAIHGAQPLILNNDEQSEAQRLLELLVNYWYVDSSQTCERNYFMDDLTSDSELNDELAKKIVAKWYDTGKDYDYSKEPSSSLIDPFTQVVWQKTTKLCLVMRENGDKFYLIAAYTPKGNLDDEYVNNVIRPIVQ